MLSTLPPSIRVETQQITAFVHDRDALWLLHLAGLPHRGSGDFIAPGMGQAQVGRRP